MNEIRKSAIQFPNNRNSNRQSDALSTKPELRPGDQNEYVYDLQRYLIMLEFLRGEPNGIFGFNTTNAVRSFQLNYQLPVTGIVDVKTWIELENALGNPFPSNRPVLAIGAQGASVKQLEQRLIVLGLLNQPNDGIFDQATKNAVMQFQTLRNLPADGIVGPRTWSELDRAFAAVDQGIPTLKPTIQQGDENDYVLLLQNMLTAFGYFKGIVNGYFGPDTRDAVIKFQETYSLNPNGVVEYFTWDVLDSLIRPTFTNLPLLRQGSTAPEVLILQEKLKVLGYFSGTITGSFGPETTTAVKEFQKSNNLSADGIVGPKTWVSLFQLTAIVAEVPLNPEQLASVLEKPTIRYGDSNDYVKELQRDLTTLMFYTGEISGKFDQKTLDAVKAFQVNNKLTADGIVGRQTWSALIYLYSPLAICGSGGGGGGGTTPTFKGIVVDAGHGGNDPGAVSSQITEKDYTLRISQYMFNRFRELGVPVAMTRPIDETLSSTERVRRIKEPFGDDKGVILVSNHINAGGGEGAEVIYALRNNSDLATKILNELGNAGQIKRSVYQRALPSDPSEDYYYIMRDTTNLQPVIVEYGFLDNANDILKLQKYWDDYSEATVKAVMSYIGKPYTPPGAATGKVTYVVQRGDTLFSIASNFNTTVESIKSLNNLTSNILTVGQVLTISGANVPTPPPSGNVVYIVQPGDSLWTIATRFNTTVAEIKRVNNLTSDSLAIGQQLFIPGVSVEVPATSPTVYTVQYGDTLYSIASRFNTTVALLRSTNNLTSDVLTVGQRLVIPGTGANAPETIIHTVVSGDNLWSLATRYNTTVDAIKSINNLTSNILTIGQQLKIPVGTPSSSTFIHTVVNGENLWSIATRFNTTVDIIKSLNNLTSSLLSVGQQLKIPS